MGEKMTLLPCPFCGHAELFDQWPCEWLDGSGVNVVRCPMCHGAAPEKCWNRRHLTQPAQAVDVGAIREVIHYLYSFRHKTPPTWAHLDNAADKLTAALPSANGKEGIYMASCGKPLCNENDHHPLCNAIKDTPDAAR